MLEMGGGKTISSFVSWKKNPKKIIHRSKQVELNNSHFLLLNVLQPNFLLSKWVSSVDSMQC